MRSSSCSAATTRIAATSEPIPVGRRENRDESAISTPLWCWPALSGAGLDIGGTQSLGQSRRVHLVEQQLQRGSAAAVSCRCSSILSLSIGAGTQLLVGKYDFARIDCG